MKKSKKALCKNVEAMSSLQQASIVGGSAPTIAQVDSMFSFDATTNGQVLQQVFLDNVALIYATTLGKEMFTDLYNMGGYYSGNVTPITIHDMSKDVNYGSNQFFANTDFYDNTNKRIDIGFTGTAGSATDQSENNGPNQLYFISQALWHAQQHIAESRTSDYYGGTSSSIYYSGTNVLDPTLSSFHTSVQYEVDADIFAKGMVDTTSLIFGTEALGRSYSTAVDYENATNPMGSIETTLGANWATLVSIDANINNNYAGGLIGSHLSQALNAYNNILANFANQNSFFTASFLGNTAYNNVHNQLVASTKIIRADQYLNDGTVNNGASAGGTSNYVASTNVIELFDGNQITSTGSYWANAASGSAWNTDPNLYSEIQAMVKYANDAINGTSTGGIYDVWQDPFNFAPSAETQPGLSTNLDDYILGQLKAAGDTGIMQDQTGHYYFAPATETSWYDPSSPYYWAGGPDDPNNPDGGDPNSGYDPFATDPFAS